MKQAYREYEFDDGFSRLDFAVLREWLAGTYWSPGIREAEIRQGAENSTLVAGCYLGTTPVGFLRVISDRTRFGYLMDVYVDPAHRGKGIARHLVRFAVDHPDLKDVYLWLLATRDGQPVYAKAGFGPLPQPDNWMILRKEKNWP